MTHFMHFFICALAVLNVLLLHTGGCPDFNADFQEAPAQCGLVYEANRTTVTCQRADLTDLFDFVSSLPDLSAVDGINLDCQRKVLFTILEDENSFGSFGARLLNANLTVSHLHFNGCVIYLDSLTSRSLIGLEAKLQSISFVCCQLRTIDYHQPLLNAFYSSLLTAKSLQRFNFLNNTIRYPISYGTSTESLLDYVDAQWCVYDMASHNTSVCFCNQRHEILTIRCPFTTVETIRQMIDWSDKNYTLLIERLIYSTPNFGDGSCNSNSYQSPINFVLKSCESPPDDAKHYEGYAFMCLINHFKFRVNWHRLEASNCHLTVQNLSTLYFYDRLEEGNYLSIFRQLQDLNLNNNGLAFLNSSLLVSTEGNISTNIQSLNLSHNSIGQLNVDSLNLLTKLKHLDLSFNSITYIDPAAFAQNVALETLNLTYNTLSTIHAGLFVNLKNLKHLDFRHCEIKLVPRGAFLGTFNLEYLDLTSNSRLVVEHEGFAGLQSLRSLSLSLTEQSWSNSIISNMHLLENVDLEFEAGDSPPGDIISFLADEAQELTTVKSLIIRTYIDVREANTSGLCKLFTGLPLLQSLSLPQIYNPCNPFLMKYLQARYQLGNFTFHSSSEYDTENIKCTFIEADGNETTIPFLEYLNHSNFWDKRYNSTLADSDLFDSNLSNINLKPNQDRTPPGINQDAENVLRGQRLVLGVSIGSSIAVAVLFSGIFVAEVVKMKKEKIRDAARHLWSRMLADTVGSDDKKRDGILTRFYSTTTIHGFLFIVSARTKLEKALWYVFITLFTGIMVHDVGNILVQYRYDVATTVSLVRNDEFRQQPFTVCLPTERNNVWPNAHDIENILYDSSTPCPRPDPFPIHISFYRDFLMRRLSHQYAWEGGVVDDKESFLEETAKFSILDRFIQSKNITMHQLLEKLDILLCKKLNMRARLIVENSDTLAAANTEVLNEQLCEHVFNGTFGLTFYDDMVTKTACFMFPGMFSFSGQFASGLLTMRALAPIQKSDIELDIHGYPYRKESLQGGSPFLFASGQETTVTMAATNALQSLEFDRVNKRRCYRGCIGTVRTDAIQTECMCRPLMWPTHSDPTLPDCSLANYAQCNLTLWDTFPICKNKIPCEHWQYSISVTSKSDVGMVADDISLRFNITNGLYIVTEEDFSMTLPTFMSNLGGVISLWLGASFMGIIHLIICCCESCKRTYNDRLFCKGAAKSANAARRLSSSIALSGRQAPRHSRGTASSMNGSI